MKILVDGSYINNSGGKVLLESFIDKVLELKIENDFFFIFDKRFFCESVNLLPKDNYCIISSNTFNRIWIFFSVLKQYNFHSVLCFNNLPPPFFLNHKVYIYFHNIFYFDFEYLSFIQRGKFFLKRNFILFFNCQKYNWVVQNNSTLDLLNRFITKNPLFVLPFYTEYKYFKKEAKKYDFIYVANNSPQKNINLLLDVWEDLSHENYFPSLLLTIGENENQKLLCRIQSLINNGVKIVNLGLLSHTEIIYFYSISKALIFPSKCESFGLPLIEAALSNMPIIASNKPYVHDIIETSYLFDPSSKVSILECVKSSFLSIDNLKIAKLKCENKLNNLINILYV
jgi:glycosyltransferase involved in cell wall biosynthesis